MANLSSIVLVEDDMKLGALLEEFLIDHGFDVRWERRGDIAKRRILQNPPDLVILDLGLPGEDGMSVCREIRPTFDGGIIMLTARQSDKDQVAGLNEGADDYVIKPPKPPVLLARIESVLRRRKTTSGDEAEVLEIGDLGLDRSRLRVTISGAAVDMTPTEFRVLWCLGEAAGQVVSRDTLYNDALGAEWDGLDRRVDVYLSKIRRKLYDAGLSPERLISVRGEGYLLTPS